MRPTLALNELIEPSDRVKVAKKPGFDFSRAQIG